MFKKITFQKAPFVFIVLFFIIGYIVYPLIKLFLVSIHQPEILKQLIEPTLLTASFNSVLLSVITVMSSAVIGVYFAYIFHYVNIKFKSFFSSIVLLPIAIPPMVGVMSFLFLLGENGLLVKVFGLHHFSFSGWGAIIAIHLFSFYPLFFLFATNALKSTDNSTVEAAYILGASKFKTFFSVILPQLKFALVGASLLCFMASMASFSAPFIFGGSERFLTTEIYYAKINGDTSFSALIALLLAIISIIVLMLLNIYRKKIPAVGKSKGTARVTPLSIYSQNKWMINLVVYLFCLAIILPVLSLFIISLMPEGALMQSAENYHFTFENYSKLFSSNDFVEPFLTSVYTSVIAVLFTLFLGVVIALIGRGKSNWFTSTLETIVSIPYGIPGTVIAVGLILCFNSPVIFSFNTILIGTFWILPIAYTIRNLPILTQSVKNGLAAIDPSIEEASSSLGAGRFKTFLAITLPIVLPSIAEGALLVFINSFGEFVATVLLYSYSTKTLSIEVYAQMRLYNNAMAATYGMVIFLIVLSMVYLSRWMLNKRYYQK